MHFTTLFILKGEKLENLSHSEIENMFFERYCYGCGENTPKYMSWCDWFQIGGRWCDILQAKKGIHCTRSFPNEDMPTIKNEFSIVQISDLTAPLPRVNLYSIATKSRMYVKENDWQDGAIVDEKKFNKFLDDIDNKVFDGVIAVIDCHG